MQSYQHMLINMPYYIMAGLVIGFSVCLFKAMSTITGGFSGLSLIGHYLFPFLTVGTVLVLLNVPCLLFGIYLKGLPYCAGTIVGIVMVSSMTDLTIWLLIDRIPIYDNILYRGIIVMGAGAIMGAGMGVFLRFGINPGGFTIVLRWVSEKINVRLSIMVLVTDAMVLLLGWVTFLDTVGLMYSALSIVPIAVFLEWVKPKKLL